MTETLAVSTVRKDAPVDLAYIAVVPIPIEDPKILSVPPSQVNSGEAAKLPLNAY